MQQTKLLNDFRCVFRISSCLLICNLAYAIRVRRYVSKFAQFVDQTEKYRANELLVGKDARQLKGRSNLR